MNPAKTVGEAAREVPVCHEADLTVPLDAVSYVQVEIGFSLIPWSMTSSALI